MSRLREIYQSYKAEKHIDDKTFIIQHSGEILETLSAFENILRKNMASGYNNGAVGTQDENNIYSHLQDLQSRISNNVAQFCNDAANERELQKFLGEIFSMQDIIDASEKDPELFRHVIIRNISRMQSRDAIIRRKLINYIVFMLGLLIFHIILTGGAYLPHF